MRSLKQIQADLLIAKELLEAEIVSRPEDDRSIVLGAAYRKVTAIEQDLRNLQRRAEMMIKGSSEQEVVVHATAFTMLGWRQDPK